MAWELLAIWAIVITVLTWFVRDEKRLRAEADVARAASYYAHAAKYRHVTPQPIPIPLPARRAGGLSEDQRRVLKALQR